MTATSELVTVRCPPLVDYSKDFQTQTANELVKLPGDNPLSTMIVDYGKLRKACRAVENE